MFDLATRLVEIMAAPGGAVVAIAEVYVDESGTHSGSPILTVGGYVFLRSGAKKFAQEWGRVLRQHGLRYFHTSDCALGKGDYEGWPVEKRIALETSLIKLVRGTSKFAFATGLNEGAYKSIVQSRISVKDSPYAFLLQHCSNSVQAWKERSGFNGEVNYIFEAGHQSASEAASALNRSISLSQPSGIKSFAFVGKEQAPQLQAADLISWLSRNTMMKLRDNKPVRKDYVALVRPGDLVRYYDEVMLEAFYQGVKGNMAAIAQTEGYAHVAPPPRQSH